MDKCIMPEMPYCPACEYGYVVYKYEDYDGIKQPVDCEWHCMIEENINKEV